MPRTSSPTPAARPGAASAVRIIPSTDAVSVAALLDRTSRRDSALERRVAHIVDEVRRGGDEALMAYATQFDSLSEPLEVPREEIRRAARGVTPDVRKAIALASRHIRKVAEKQVPKGWSVRTAGGVTIEQRVIPLERVGCYVPGGLHPLPSSLLMTAIPARAAGVREVIAVCPRVDQTIMCAAQAAGVSRLFRVGGAHAIAALAYGTATIPRVDKIVGPGNAYVAAAKALVSRECPIDFYAGPSEIVVVSISGRPAWIAADLLAQAEHDTEARAILLTPSRKLADAVALEIGARMPADGPASRAMSSNGGIVVTHTLAEAIDLCQRMAP
jgi:histidinol dehydrogenase